MLRNKTFLLLILSFLLLPNLCWPHPRHSDPILAELNEYLMALQILREEDPAAERLFQLWQQLRTASWKIRELTDEQDLSAESDEVRAQRQTTEGLRRELREEALDYFSSWSRSVPSARIEIGERVSLDWEDPLFRVEVGARAVVPIRLTNSSQGRRYLELASQEKNEILFWEKSVVLDPGASRYSFALIAPTSPGPISNRIVVREAPTRQLAIDLRAEGIAAPEVFRGSQDDAGPWIRFRVRDSETRELLPARVEVSDQEGNLYWEPLMDTAYAVTETRYGHGETPLWDHQPGPFFYIDGEARLGVDPSGKSARFFHGFEYLPGEVEVPEDGLVEVELKKWIDMKELGWYPGQTHIHTTDQGLPVPFFPSWPIVSAAEGLSVSYILTLKGEWTTHAIYADEYPMGRIPLDTGSKNLIAYGEEYRNNPYGHLCFLGLDQLIQPISSGALGELGGPDYPPNAFVLDAALAQGASTVGAHFGLSITDENPIRVSWPSTGFEMPIDVALGKLQLAEIYGNGGQLDIWYKLLNCGFELAATAGPDWVIADTPRTYVYLGGRELTLENWREGLEAGRSFITRGPMIFFSIEGAQAGSRLHLAEGPAELAVKGLALTPEGPQPVEILVNGEVVLSGTNLETSISLDESAWIALRTENAHSNPIYVTLGGRPIASAEDAETFLGVADRLSKWVKEKGIFDTEAQKRTVLEVIARGRAVFAEIVEGDSK